MTVARWVGMSKAKHKTWTRKSTVSVLLSDVALGSDLLVRRGSCQKWVEARSKPCRRWKDVPNSRQNNPGLSLFSERMESPQRVFDAEESEAVIKTHGEGARWMWWVCNSGRRPAARQDPPCRLRWESVLQRRGLRHLGMRTLVPFVMGSLVNCYTGVTEFKRFLERWALRCLDIIIGQQSWNTNKSRHHFPPN